MSTEHRSGFWKDFKWFFGRGMAVLLPTVLTIWLLWQAGVFLFENVGRPINQGIRWVIVWATPYAVDEGRLPVWFSVPDEQLNSLIEERNKERERVGRPPMSRDVLRAELRRENFRAFWNERWYLEFAGLAVAIVLIYLAGRFLGGFIGRSIYSRVESFIRQVPGFKQVYPHVKQVVDLVLGEKKTAFRRVVLVEYPRKGIWSLGLVTSDSLKTVQRASGQDKVLTIFVPSTPTPFTGFTINVVASDVIDVPITIDEAVRYFITGGVLVPEKEGVNPSLPGSHKGGKGAPT